MLVCLFSVCLNVSLSLFCLFVNLSYSVYQISSSAFHMFLSFRPSFSLFTIFILSLYISSLMPVSLFSVCLLICLFFCIYADVFICPLGSCHFMCSALYTIYFSVIVSICMSLDLSICMFIIVVLSVYPSMFTSPKISIDLSYFYTFIYLYPFIYSCISLRAYIPYSLITFLLILGLIVRVPLLSRIEKERTTFKSALFGVDQSGPPLLKPDGTLAYCPREKAALFADVFDGKQCGDDLSMPLTCFPEPKLTKIAFKSREIKNLLAELDVYGGAGPDGIFPMLFVRMSDFLAPKISTIFRKLTRPGHFSICWRTGHITPVPKGSGAGSCPSEYRPISITPVLSKVFERLLAKRLYAYAESNNLFPNLQFGFRKGLGTCDALLTISNTVQKALDLGQEVRMIGLDFSAAFDRVNHKALLFKLKQLGIGGPFFNILSEFLSNRTQRVVVDGQLGDLRPVVSGVPQGSVLGPLLFILYTHDMWFGLENMLVSYADDATLLAVVPSPAARLDVSDSLNRDLAKISSWCRNWGMLMNPTKTQSMIVGRSRTVHPPHPDLLIDNVPLVNSNSFKILGVQFDQKFTFEAHLRATSSLIAQKLGLLRKSFKIFNDQSILRKCFYSFILPCFEYCSPVWSSAAVSHLRLLDRNLNACKFLIPDLIIDLWHRRSISSLCMLYKIFHNPEHPLHSELPNLFQPVRMTRNVANSHSLSFCPVRCNTVQYSRSFIPAFVKSWNDLPEEVVECSELQRFKTGANRFLLNLQV